MTTTTANALFLVVILVVIVIVLFISGLWQSCWHAVLRFFYHEHKKFRRHQRPSRIFLIRHGQSQANVDTSLYARVADHQIELTETGHEQAREAGKKLRSMIGKESVYVYMSPYKRSKQTWANIRRSFSPLQIITEREDPRIREQEFGNLADLATQPRIFQERDRLGHFFYRFSCGESGADVYDRVSLFLETLFREMDNGHHDPTQNIVIVSHELFMRLFLMRYFRWSVEEIESFRSFNNCEIVELKKKDGVYMLDGHRRPPTNSS